MGRLRLTGLPAWLMWLFVHIFFLIGHRNRFIVMFQWALAYFSFKRTARIILAGDVRQRRDTPVSTPDMV